MEIVLSVNFQTAIFHQLNHKLLTVVSPTLNCSSQCPILCRNNDFSVDKRKRSKCRQSYVKLVLCKSGRSFADELKKVDGFMQKRNVSF